MMNNLGRRISSSADSVFIEKDHNLEIDSMRVLLGEGSISDIQKYLFPSAKSNEFDVGKLAQTQINRHSKALNYRNKEILKSLLQQGAEASWQNIDMKAYSEHKTNYSGVEEDRDIHQYLTVDEDIDFMLYTREK